MGIPGTTCHSSVHPRVPVCVYTCTRARAHLRHHAGATSRSLARSLAKQEDRKARRQLNEVGKGVGDQGKVGGSLNRMHRSTDLIARSREKKNERT